MRNKTLYEQIENKIETMLNRTFEELHDRSTPITNEQLLFYYLASKKYNKANGVLGRNRKFDENEISTNIKWLLGSVTQLDGNQQIFGVVLANLLNKISTKTFESTFKQILNDRTVILHDNTNLSPEARPSSATHEDLLNPTNLSINHRSIALIELIKYKDQLKADDNLHKRLDPLINTLINEGINHNIQNSAGETPLIAAAKTGNNQVVNKLLRNTTNTTTRNPFQILRNRILSFFGKIANPALADKNGRTALRYAAEKGYAGAVSALLDKITDEKQIKHALKIAIRNKDKPTTNIILSKHKFAQPIIDSLYSIQNLRESNLNKAIAKHTSFDRPKITTLTKRYKYDETLFTGSKATKSDPKKPEDQIKPTPGP